MATVAFLIGQKSTLTPEPLNGANTEDPGAVVSIFSLALGSGSSCISVDATNPLAPVVTGVQVGSTTINASATGTDQDGASFNVSSASYDITVAAPSVTTVGLGINFTTPA